MARLVYPRTATRIVYLVGGQLVDLENEYRFDLSSETNNVRLPSPHHGRWQASSQEVTALLKIKFKFMLAKKRQIRRLDREGATVGNLLTLRALKLFELPPSTRHKPRRPSSSTYNYYEEACLQTPHLGHINTHTHATSTALLAVKTSQRSASCMTVTRRKDST